MGDLTALHPGGIRTMDLAIEVEISDTQGLLRVDHGELARLVRRVLAAEERPSASISLALVDNTTIHGVNLAHLEHDFPTDVISFSLSDDGEPELSGELVVSVEMAIAAARDAGVNPLHELSLYVVHGLLHLCGYDDHDGADIVRMRRREDELLAEAGISIPSRCAAVDSGRKSATSLDSHEKTTSRARKAV